MRWKFGRLDIMSGRRSGCGSEKIGGHLTPRGSWGMIDISQCFCYCLHLFFAGLSCRWSTIEWQEIGEDCTL